MNQKAKDLRQFLPELDAMLVSDWDAVCSRISDADFPRGRFLGFLSEHDLFPTLLWLVRKNAVSSRLPGWLMLRALASTNWLRRRISDLSDSLAELQSAAQDSELDIVHIKGLPFAMRYYGEVEARFTRDHDILVLPGNLRACETLLEQLGYQATGIKWMPKWLTRQVAHATTWQKGHVQVDLHHSLRSWPAGRSATRSVFRAARSLNFSGLDLQFPDDGNALMISILGLASDIETGRFRCKSLADICVMLKRMDETLDWPGWFEARREENILCPVVAALLVAREVLPQACKYRRLNESLRGLGMTGDYEPCKSPFELLASQPYGLDSRQWFMRHYSGATLPYLAWWLIGGFLREGSVGAWWKSRASK